MNAFQLGSFFLVFLDCIVHCVHMRNLMNVGLQIFWWFLGMKAQMAEKFPNCSMISLSKFRFLAVFFLVSANLLRRRDLEFLILCHCMICVKMGLVELIEGLLFSCMSAAGILVAESFKMQKFSSYACFA